MLGGVPMPGGIPLPGSAPSDVQVSMVHGDSSYFVDADVPGPSSVGPS